MLFPKLITWPPYTSSLPGYVWTFGSKNNIIIEWTIFINHLSCYHIFVWSYNSINSKKTTLLAMLTLSTNIQSYLSFLFLSSTTPCFHHSGIFYNYILYSVVLYHMGVDVREYEDCLCFYRIINSELDFYSLMC